MLPLLGSISAGLFGRKLGPQGSALVSTICLVVTFLCSCFVFFEVAILGCCVYVKLFTWVSSEMLSIDWGFMFDSLTVIMCCVISFVSSLVHLYSIEYMSHDPHLSRFMSYLSLFTFFMLILVTADNFVQMFVGWEGVGLCSFLLINFWFTRIQANKAAIKAMILNRIGDFCLILGILSIFINVKAVDYATVFSIVPMFECVTFNFLNFDFEFLSIVGIFLFFGAVGKSAQLGLHTWLPDAMEGPTPVSALIHAATMVTAGVFLLARCSPIFEYTANILEIITFFGASTAFFAATVGLLQNDLKKVIAYSTCSQLGYMIFACGLSNYSVGIFHLSNHAFFKALLFLGAGSVIHSVSDEQDMRKMGGLKHLIPFTYSMMVIGSLALIGFPFLTGFYSKDLILEVAYGKFTSVSHYSYYLGTFGAFLTAFYSTRLLYLTFLTKPNGFKQTICSAYDSSYQICIALSCLAIPSIFLGYYSKDMIVGLGTDFWGAALYVKPSNMNMLDAEFIDHFFKILPVILSLTGFFSAYTLYVFQSRLLFQFKIMSGGKKVYNFLNKKWYFDKIYNEHISQFIFKLGYSSSYKIVDRGIFEILGPNGLSIFLKDFAANTYTLQSSFLYHYAFLILIGSTFLIGSFQILDFLILDNKLIFLFCFVSML